VQLSPLAVLVSILTGGELAGVLGVHAAIPIPIAGLPVRRAGARTPTGYWKNV
jgi:predicted PurR-regulated permease PerM